MVKRNVLSRILADKEWAVPEMSSAQPYLDVASQACLPFWINLEQPTASVKTAGKPGIQDSPHSG